ncbi:MAG: anaerobic ribonucleoside-triphosphate reductase activating protein [Alphaproteobacteria bacterium]|nr:anaerobic ribonucleoside-triphosphate reductase activating protein [Alphaproteobacteria bacterium]
MVGIHAITPFTLLDFPNEMACIIWLSKCNLRCVYCHNPEIVYGEGKISDAAYIEFLERRRGQLTGVVFSGGEPTFNPDLLFYINKARDLGFKIKIDTNGTNPTVLRNLIEGKSVDYIALDYKCAPERAKELLGTDKFIAAFEQSIAILIDAAKNHNLALEIRTTLHSDLMNESDLNRMIASLDEAGYRGAYYIQNVVSVGDKTIGNISKPHSSLDVSKLIKPKNFSIFFRNFPGIPFSLEDATNDPSVLP